MQRVVKTMSSNFLSWVRKTALGHVVLFEIIGAAPLFIAFTIAFFNDGILTGVLVAKILVGSVMSMACSGLLTWFLFTRPIQRALGKRRTVKER